MQRVDPTHGWWRVARARAHAPDRRAPHRPDHERPARSSPRRFASILERETSRVSDDRRVHRATGVRARIRRSTCTTCTCGACRSTTTSRAASYWPLLSEEEQARASRFVRDMHRRRFVIAHGALRIILAGYVDTEPRVARLRERASTASRRCADRDAEPSAVEFNLSHSDDLALVAVTRTRAVGVDLERWSEGWSIWSSPSASSRPVSATRCAPSRTRPTWSKRDSSPPGRARRRTSRPRGRGSRAGLHHFDVALAPGEPARLLADRLDRRGDGAVVDDRARAGAAATPPPWWLRRPLARCCSSRCDPPHRWPQPFDRSSWSGVCFEGRTQCAVQRRRPFDSPPALRERLMRSRLLAAALVLAVTAACGGDGAVLRVDVTAPCTERGGGTVTTGFVAQDAVRRRHDLRLPGLHPGELQHELGARSPSSSSCTVRRRREATTSAQTNVGLGPVVKANAVHLPGHRRVPAGPGDRRVRRQRDLRPHHCRRARQDAGRVREGRPEARLSHRACRTVASAATRSRIAIRRSSRRGCRSPRRSAGRCISRRRDADAGIPARRAGAEDASPSGSSTARHDTQVSVNDSRRDRDRRSRRTATRTS